MNQESDLGLGMGLGWCGGDGGRRLPCPCSTACCLQLQFPGLCDSKAQPDASPRSDYNGHGWCELVVLRVCVHGRTDGRGPSVVGPCSGEATALFSKKIFYKIDTVAFSFVFDKYCLIID